MIKQQKLFSPVHWSFWVFPDWVYWFLKYPHIMYIIFFQMSTWQSNLICTCQSHQPDCLQFIACSSLRHYLSVTLYGKCGWHKSYLRPSPIASYRMNCQINFEIRLFCTMITSMLNWLNLLNWSLVWIYCKISRIWRGTISVRDLILYCYTILFIILWMEKSTPVKGNSILTNQREDPTTGFVVFWWINHACRTDQILEQNMFSSCAFHYHIYIYFLQFR